ncbi:hypothetical protein [Saprospira grandis]|uniref:hypothetical protein n=1 Tax=Saprospira grandis TaxID=1008 RepID=UPI0022DDEC87|nr:hypothetical protein [Saprospira grandis]WBM73231.1 hypothetical protein OP864_09490 [Saprospira grandis]
MNPKERKRLIAKLKQLLDHFKEYPFLALMYPGLKEQIKELEQELVYSQVEKKDKGGLFNGKALARFREYVSAIEGLVLSFKEVGTDFSSEDFLPARSWEEGKSKLAEHLPADIDRAFQPAREAIQQTVDRLSGPVNLADLSSSIKQAVEAAYSELDFSNLKNTTSLKAVRKLDIPVLTHFLDNKSRYKVAPSCGLNAKALFGSLEALLKDNNAMTVTELHADLGKVVRGWWGELTNLKSSQYAKVPVDGPKIITNLCTAVTSLGNHPIANNFAEDLGSLLQAANQQSPLILEDFIAAILSSSTDELVYQMASPEELQDIQQTTFFSDRLGSLQVADIFKQAIDKSSPYYTAAQSGFDSGLSTKLNHWKSTLQLALGSSADTVLLLDGADFSANLFKTFIANKVDKRFEAIRQQIMAIPIEDIVLSGHKDLGIFNAQWISVWSNSIGQLDLSSITHLEDIPKKVELFENWQQFLPNDQVVATALYSAISNKQDLALEAVAKVNQKVNHLQQNQQQMKAKQDAILQKQEDIAAQQRQTAEDIQSIKKEIKEIKGSIKEMQAQIGSLLDQSIEAAKAERVDIDKLVNPEELFKNIARPDSAIEAKLKEVVNEYLATKTADLAYKQNLGKVGTPPISYMGLVTGNISVTGCFSAKLKAAMAKNSPLNITLSGQAESELSLNLNLNVAQIPLTKYSLAKATLSGHLNLAGKIIAGLTITEMTKMVGRVQAGLVLSTNATLTFSIADKWQVYEYTSSSLNLLVARTPVYQASFDIKNLKFSCSSPEGGYKLEMHPDLKVALSTAANALKQASTYVGHSALNFAKKKIKAYGDLIVRAWNELPSFS